MYNCLDIFYAIQFYISYKNVSCYSLNSFFEKSKLMNYSLKITI